MSEVSALYGKILSLTREIKSGIMTEAADVIPIYGNLPEEFVKELGNLTAIESNVVDSLLKRGVEFSTADKKGYFSAEINGESYIVHESTFKKNERPLTANSEPSPISNEKEEVPSFADEENVTPVFEENNIKTEPSFEKEEFEPNEDDSVDVLKNIEPEENADNVSVENLENDFAEPELKATIIGEEFNNEPVVAPMDRDKAFVEEKRKASDEFVYDSHRISVCHAGSKPEDMQFMIAPLKIQKYACPTTPIIVSVYYKGRIYTASSYDKNEDGRYIVEIDINEYYFLCRGFFNDKGEFQSTISTTGLSVSQKDTINPISLEKHRPTGPDVKNGHLKFKYEGAEGPGVIEVFPLEMEEDEFLIMSICGDFIDYIPISKKSHGMNRALIYDNGVKSEVVCQWDGDFLEADIVPL